ncbi:MAG: TIGR03067 domain-containing protein [Gemmataceae bacterium]|nr:TIGR03067 domain-containing protein [Gemmata sp.]MDW8198080.1 TIGR03067 domain-containing protein [Gemmataceae bacterium]
MRWGIMCWVLRCGVGLSVILAVSACRQNSEPADLTFTLTSIEGTYFIIGLESEGEAMTPAELAKAQDAERTIRITATQMITTRHGEDDPVNYTINTSRQPFEIDMTGVGDTSEEKTYGIFKVEGNRLYICAVESTNPDDRPKEFKTTKENKAMLMVLQKQP